MIIFNAIDRYLIRLITVPLVTTLIVSAMLMVLDKMLKLFDFVANQGGPVSVVWRMLANMLPEYMSLGIPIGLMLGILLAFRKLALQSELDILRAVGISYSRLLRIPYIFAFFFALVNVAIVGYIEPYSHYAYEDLRYELRSGALGAAIKVGEFTKLGQHMTLRVEGSQDNGRNLTGIFGTSENPDNGQKLTITADSGRFMPSDDPNIILLRLNHGLLIHNRPDFTTPRVLSFQNHDLPIKLPAVESFRGWDGNQQEMTLTELVYILHHTKLPVKLRAQLRANFHFRIVEVVTMFLLPMLALTLAIPPKRSTSALGVFLSILIIVTDHKLNQYCEAIGGLGKIDPIIVLWTPFLLFALLVWRMYYTLAYVPGGQPIGALEWFFARVSSRIVQFFKKFSKRKVKA
ncbi:LPS export ABC transporter permease LptF [Zymomonas mobilis]|uniref:Permease YjgP/YjgQ family protein n=1 Tax=Zymomonas mobilis subsp. pomaceae (strain ATCC 29192 / DSM 22645 / JCM 10191 / CCUG 17912 / NBRC 13757 / NCIMB 11200 / NRRL B-4491 / Barker I) TaxID=579138 RepID=F8ERU7_ZYMMT|nr:LPS export ABC transporter permease LptF [Zymomonas mobilis]AEI38560.1 permease YjgP/YjgQ family protein [Zymomonas mobilis subsp. pomaceae ATCC 29192]MDX5948250.1 LPS export ABC transporter permease LptF [Zymomonas mobilis subsp. pomaceae]GEB89005.1 hypothetical protein ZMO02_06420 [Zymomonas mobilis subsp. pomaceae]